MDKSFSEKYKELTPEVLASLAHDPDPDIRCVAAYHPNTSSETLAMLLKDKNPVVRELALYRSAPLEDVPF